MITAPHKVKQKAKLPAGILPGDSNIEFVGIKDTKTVLWFQHGNNHRFIDLPLQHFEVLKTEYLSTPRAVKFLNGISQSLHRQVELFTYYMYGDLDTTPDIENGVLSPSENFRDRKDCPSLLWNKKNITIDGKNLDEREIMIIDMINENLPDKAICTSLGVAHSTFDGLKRNLFRKTSTNSKVALIKKAIEQKVTITE